MLLNGLQCPGWPLQHELSCPQCQETQNAKNTVTVIVLEVTFKHTHAECLCSQQAGDHKSNQQEETSYKNK